MLIPVSALLGALVALLLITALVCVLWFFSISVFFVPSKARYGVYEVIVTTEISVLTNDLILDVSLFIDRAISTGQEILNNTLRNIIPTIAIAAIAAGAIGFLAFQDTIVENWITLRQCGIAPLRDRFVFQLVNLVTVVYDAANPILIAIFRIQAFFMYTWLQVAFECADEKIFFEVINELGLALRELFDAINVVLLSQNALNERLPLAGVFYHLGQGIRALTPVVTCLCRFFDFLWDPLLRIPTFLSIHIAADCGANIFVRLFQGVIRPFAGTEPFTLTPLGEEWSCYSLSLGDAIQDILLQTIQMFTGVIAEILTPCGEFSDDPNKCNVLGHCFFDYGDNACREFLPCDVHITRDDCQSESTCCFDAIVRPEGVYFQCSTSLGSADECPSGGSAGCASLTTISDCNVYAGVCLWNQTASICTEHANICASATNENACLFLTPFCGDYGTQGACNANTNGLCTWNSNSATCQSRVEICYAINATGTPDIDCRDLQLCDWDVTDVVTQTATCVSRDRTDATTLGASAEVNATFQLPGSDAPSDSVSKRFGAPIILTVLKTQWTHVILETLNFLVRSVFQIVDDIASGAVVFGTYEGMAKLRIGFLFDFLRSAVNPIASLTAALDPDFPCAIRRVLEIPVDGMQGIIEIIFLIIYFSIYQPTGRAETVYLWSPFDFLASYYNDVKVPFEPLIFIDGQVKLLELVSDRVYKYSPANPNITEVVFDLFAGTITVDGMVYDYNNVSLSGLNIVLVDIFPGIDRTIPGIIDKLKESSECIERVVGNGTNETDQVAPWACALRHAVNVIAEMVNIILQIVFFIADILRFTDQPVYRKNALDVFIEGFYDEWRLMATCFTNMIRLLDDTPDAILLCKVLNEDQNGLDDVQSFMCCAADLVEGLLSGAILSGIQELAFFLRSLIGISFMPGKIPYLPRLHVIINDLEILVDRLACTIAQIIPDDWQCNMEVNDENDDPPCTLIFDGVPGTPCKGPFECKLGNVCIKNFIASLIRLVLVPLKIVNKFYIQIQGIFDERSNCDWEGYDGPDGDVNGCLELGCRYDANTKDCQQAVVNTATGEGLIDFFIDIVATLASGFFEILHAFALVIDCLGCTIKNAAEKEPADTPCGHPIFDFVRLLLDNIYRIFITVLRLALSLIVFVVTFFVALFSGSFDIILELFEMLGNTLKNTIDTLLNTVLYLLLEVFHLREAINGLIYIINTVVVGICNFLNEVIKLINSIPLLPDLALLDCSAAYIPPIGEGTGPPVDPATQCEVISSETTCGYFAYCAWSQAQEKCIQRVGCGLGNTRDKCIQGALEVAGTTSACVFQTTAFLNQTTAQGGGVAYYQCHNVSQEILDAPGQLFFPGNCSALVNKTACTPWTGICYWDRLNEVCVDSHGMCQANIEQDACNNMENFCGAASQTNQSYCEDPDFVNGLCQWRAFDGTCLSRSKYCLDTTFSTDCSLIFSCKWYPTETLPNGTRLGTCLTSDQFNYLTANPSKVFDTQYLNTYRKRNLLVEMAEGTTLRRSVFDEQAAEQALPPFAWPSGDECATRLPLNGQGNTAFEELVHADGPLDYDQFAQVAYCVGRVLWHVSVREKLLEQQRLATVSPLLAQAGGTGETLMMSSCDVLFEYYYGMEKTSPTWSSFRPLERVEFVECVKQRALNEYVRLQSGFTWLPRDFTYNHYSKIRLAFQGLRASRVLRQYNDDRTFDPSVLLDPAYAAAGRADGLNMAYLAEAQTPEEMAALIESRTLLLYFTENGMGLREMQMALDLQRIKGAFLEGIGKGLSSLMNNANFNLSRVSFSDIFVNASGHTAATIMMSSLGAAVYSAGDAANQIYSLSTNTEVRKRFAPAAKSVGKIVSHTLTSFADWYTNVRANPPPIPEAPTVSEVVNTAAAFAANTTMGRRWSRNVRSAYNILWRNEAAAERRAKMTFFGQQLRFTIRMQFFAEASSDPVAARAAVLADTDPVIVQYARAQGLLEPTECLTGEENIGTDWLCDYCLVADRLLGRIISVAVWLVKYYTGNDPALYHTFPRAYGQFREVSSYLVNDTAPVRVGDSVDNPVRWPWHNRNNWGYFGDTQPDKKRFYDYGDLIVELIQAAQAGINDPQSLGVVQLVDSVFNFLWSQSMTLVFSTAMNNVRALDYVASVVVSDWEAVKADILERNAPGAAARPVGEVLYDLAISIFGDVVTCDFPGDLDGSRKRFSLGEVLALATILVVVGAALVIGLQISGFSMGSTGMILLTVAGTLLLIVTYNYGVLCGMALPQPLAGDVRDLVVYSIQPKCESFLSGTINEEYNNTNCYTCSDAEQFTSASCVADLGFYTLLDNIAFTTVAVAPGFLDFLADFGLTDFVENTTAGGYLAKWQASYNPSDPINFSQHHACNWIFTLVPNIVITAAIIFVFFLYIWPWVSLSLYVARRLLARSFGALQLLFYTLKYQFYMMEALPFLRAYGSLPDDYEPDEEVEDQVELESFDARSSRQPMTHAMANSARDLFENMPLRQAYTMLRQRRPRQTRARTWGTDDNDA